MKTVNGRGKNPTACLLIIGNELLSGQVRDENLTYLASRLQAKGIDLTQARFIPDEANTIITTIRELKPLYTYLFTTGGIGPTHDDITSSCVAQAFDEPLVCSIEAYRNMTHKYPNSKATEALARMSLIPRGASLIFNRLSAAPGFCLENVYVLAGVPNIMQAMFEEVEPTLQGGQPPFSCEVLIHVVEGLIAKELETLQNTYTRTEIGSYPLWGHGVSRQVRIIVKSFYEEDMKEVEARLKTLAATFEAP